MEWPPDFPALGSSGITKFGSDSQFPVKGRAVPPDNKYCICNAYVRLIFILINKCIVYYIQNPVPKCTAKHNNRILKCSEYDAMRFGIESVHECIQVNVPGQ